MKLGDAQAGQVVRNDKNGSYYRYERQDGERSRIWPLETFPNGLLIPKTAPTTVSASLVVTFIGEWHEDFAVAERDSVQKRRREKYTKILAAEREKLALFLVEYEALPTDGVGKQSRGSWSNKIKAVEVRIFNIERGLAERESGGDTSPRSREASPRPSDIRPVFEAQSLVQLPSGRPALVLDMQQADSGRWMALIKTKQDDGGDLVSPLPCEVLRPWSLSRVGTV